MLHTLTEKLTKINYWFIEKKNQRKLSASLGIVRFTISDRGCFLKFKIVFF